MQLFYQPEIPAGKLFLDIEESRHCIKVLRKKKGDLIDLTDGKGTFYRAEISHSDPGKCEFEIISSEETPAKKYFIHVVVAPTKNIDRMEWFVEKCTEIGIDEFSFIICKNSERGILKMERFIKKSVSAMKQSLKSNLPVMNEPVSFPAFINGDFSDSDNFIAYVDSTNPESLYQAANKERKYCILIGPEGDFSKSELDLAIGKNFIKVNLGNSRLRTETAGIVACHTLNLINSR